MLEYNPIINSIEFKKVSIDILRLDLIHPLYGGNKFFKLKYNLEKAKGIGQNTILTFGGAHSNHIYSTAAICKELGFNCIGVIRGEEELIERSPTLQFALENGMKLHFISRGEYGNKTEVNLNEELNNKFGNFYLIPEGGNNIEGVKGSTEIMTNDLNTHEYVFCACGTATTFSGIKISADPDQKVIGISVLKGENKLIVEANRWFTVFNSREIEPDNDREIKSSTILDGYHFGGYAGYSKELIDFKKNFETDHNIPLDHVYTSKLFYAVFDLIEKRKVKAGSKILVVHSGGLQGNKGFETRYKIKQ